MALILKRALVDWVAAQLQHARWVAGGEGGVDGVDIRDLQATRWACGVLGCRLLLAGLLADPVPITA